MNKFEIIFKEILGNSALLRIFSLIDCVYI